MSQNTKTDTEVWRKKAMAFATRSHRHLWGKNNQDPLAFLFQQGLKNQFAKDMYIGWNKFAQERPAANWGLLPDPEIPNKFVLPAGIVVPFIQEKILISVFIQTYDDNGPKEVFTLPGSLKSTLVLGEPDQQILILNRLMDGLFLYQETGGESCIIIHPHPDRPLDEHVSDLLNDSVSIIYLKDQNDSENLHGLPGSVNATTRSYIDKNDLLSKALDV